MKKFIDGYRQAIVKDVNSQHYRKHQRWTGILFTIFGFAFLLTYLTFFHSFVWKSPKVFYMFHLVGLDSTQDPALRFLIYKYEYLIYFLVFFMLFSLFAVVSFFAFDMQQRNEIIRSRSASDEEENSWL